MMKFDQQIIIKRGKRIGQWSFILSRLPPLLYS